MAQFDRFFARSWATPVRRGLPADQNEGSDDENDFSEFRRNISGRLPTPGATQSGEKARETFCSLASFVSEHGFEPNIEPSLNMFVQHHGISDRLRLSSSGKFAMCPKSVFLALIGTQYILQQQTLLSIHISETTPPKRKIHLKSICVTLRHPATHHPPNFDQRESKSSRSVSVGCR